MNHKAQGKVIFWTICPYTSNTVHVRFEGFRTFLYVFVRRVFLRYELWVNVPVSRHVFFLRGKGLDDQKYLMCENKNVMTDITTRNLAFIFIFKVFLVIGLFAHINLKEARNYTFTNECLAATTSYHLRGANRCSMS